MHLHRIYMLCLRRCSSLLLLLVLLVGCTEPSGPATELQPLIDVPPGFPEQVFPPDNMPTPERVALGKALFFSKAFSSDNSIACVSCHAPANAFADTRAVSEGVAGRFGTRNAPSLANVGYFPYYLREGSLPTLEMQVLVPIQEHDEFDMNILDVAERLRSDTTLVRMSKQAYGRDIDAFAITRAIACYERTLVSGRSRYDAYAYGVAQAAATGQSSTTGQSALNSSEMNGMRLFFSGRTRCSSCHGGFAFTNHAFTNNGLYDTYADPGRFRFTKVEADKATFKTPSLRNVAVTAPYMHDGSVTSLEAVVAHYNSGGRPHANRSNLLRPLGLSFQDQEDLVLFLRSLTDESFISRNVDDN